MYKKDQPFRLEATYHGEHSNYEAIPVRVIDEVEIDDPTYGPGQGWKIRLPVTGKVVEAFDEDFKLSPDSPETLQEKTDRLLTWYHPMCAGFFVEALLKYADAVLADEDATREALKNGFIGADAWIEAAKATKEVFEDRPGRG